MPENNTYIYNNNIEIPECVLPQPVNCDRRRDDIIAQGGQLYRPTKRVAPTSLSLSPSKLRLHFFILLLLFHNRNGNLSRSIYLLSQHNPKIISEREELNWKDERDHKHTHRSGRNSGRQLLLGALLPRTRHPARWNDARVLFFSFSSSIVISVRLVLFVLFFC